MIFHDGVHRSLWFSSGLSAWCRQPSACRALPAIPPSMVSLIRCHLKISKKIILKNFNSILDAKKKTKRSTQVTSAKDHFRLPSLDSFSPEIRPITSISSGQGTAHVWQSPWRASQMKTVHIHSTGEPSLRVDFEPKIRGKNRTRMQSPVRQVDVFFGQVMWKLGL